MCTHIPWWRRQLVVLKRPHVCQTTRSQSHAGRKQIRSYVFASEKKAKYKVVLCTQWRHTGGVEVWLHSFVTPALVAGAWLTSRIAHFNLGSKPWYPLNMRLGGRKRRSGGFGEKQGVIFWAMWRFSARILTLWRRNYFFLILEHPVYKMWIIQEPNKFALWNKLHFEEKKKRRV